MANRGRTELREWIDQQYANEPKLRERVKELMAEMEIEQQLVALREARRVSQHTLAKVLGVIASRLSPNWRPGALRTESLKLSCVTSALLGGGKSRSRSQSTEPGRRSSIFPERRR